MAVYFSPGLILRRINLGEADRILTILLPDGKVNAVARGVRKIGSRLAGHLELFSETKLGLAKGRNLEVVTAAQLVHYPADSLTEPMGLRLAYLYAECLDKLIQEGQSSMELFKLAQNSFRGLSSTAWQVQELAFKLRLLRHLGVAPQLRACVVCGGRKGALWWVSASKGGLVDTACRAPMDLLISQDAIALWRSVYNGPIFNLEGFVPLAEDTLPSVNGFIDYHFGFKPKTELVW